MLKIICTHPVFRGAESGCTFNLETLEPRTKKTDFDISPAMGSQKSQPLIEEEHEEDEGEREDLEKRVVVES